MIKVSKLLTARISNSVWLTPEGKIIDAYDYHGGLAQVICKDFGQYDLDIAEATDYLISKDWVRIGCYLGDTFAEAKGWDGRTLVRVQDALQKLPHLQNPFMIMDSENMSAVTVPLSEFEAMRSTDDLRQYRAASLD